MMARTCEELVIEELEALRENEAGLLGIISDLKDEVKRLKEQPDTEYEPHEVEALKLNEPIDTVTLSVADTWDMRSKDGAFEQMAVSEIRALMETDDGLHELAEKRCRYYDEKAVTVTLRTFPYQIKYGKFTHAVDFGDNGKNMFDVRVLGETDSPTCRDHYVASMADSLEAYGYELFKERLARYCDDREKKEAEA